MKPIDRVQVEEILKGFEKQQVYIHMETTNGAYASHHNEGFLSAGVFLRNGKIFIERAAIKGEGPYRVGIKLPEGWLYSEGLTDFEEADGQLLLAGHNLEGRLAVALQLSKKPFRNGEGGDRHE
ncbi:YojF family protein [Bacillaceae bacterium SIJ1]|uniref:YojF family protein n=1 Tax=Litoribacterium kuwaitense TaxID=1398745 RepID=UPI0013EB37B6|nr:YojF family protein [Litoribacterium kuwaitense]NGP44016.1 YojF family protein [Litoribacterium kuwaitense]